ncbi:hypothetical protein FJZ31_24190 [Candidatus Poribacteria bacterium]|nr:hypothetical protein [Candidatus Poribacteria bacterium]
MKQYIKHTFLPLVLMLVISLGILATQNIVSKSGIANIHLWDTLSPFLDQVNVRDKTNWQLVPAGTGGVYSSKGDVVLENDYLTVIFCSKKGKVIVYSKSGEKRIELTPIQLKGKETNITSCNILQNADDKVTIEARFSAKEMAGNLPAIFSFSKEQIIEVKPVRSPKKITDSRSKDVNMKGINIFSPIEFAIVPNFISDDLIFNPKDYHSGETLYIPSENIFLGLLKGNDSMLVITWPKGKQEMRLILDNEEAGRLVESIDLENDGKSVFLAILDAPGIWHKEELKSSYLEKDVAIDWKRPFPAKWITQLYEDEVKTTYTFKEAEPKAEDFWRAGIGWYTYPVWFEEEKAVYHPGKKVPPKGESIIYFLERKGTPDSVSTPVDVMKRTLDSQTYESILDFEGRSHRSLTRPNFVVDTATCGVTDRLKPIFEAGEEVKKKEYIKGGIEDMLYFLAKERKRALEYQDFANEMIEFLTLMKREKPKSKPFLDKMKDITKEIIAAYEYEKENIKDLKYAEKLAKETEVLTQRKRPDNFAAFMKLKGEWTGMGGAVDELNRKLHTITRKLFQEAGYNCVGRQETVKIAEEIRRRAIKCLRRPVSYEIWANY